VIYLDTHAVVWLYAGEVGRFTTGGRRLLEREELLVSPMVALELEFLEETGRITVGARVIIEALTQALGLTVCDLPFAQVISETLTQVWTRDPFDRILVAQAACRGLPLLTKDKVIRAHYPRAVW